MAVTDVGRPPDGGWCLLVAVPVKTDGDGDDSFASVRNSVSRLSSWTSDLLLSRNLPDLGH